MIAPLLLAAAVQPPAGLDDRFDEVARPFVRRYCAECHGNEVQEGDLALTGYASAAAVRADPDVWDYVRERVSLAEMPPRPAARPSDAEREAFLSWLTLELASGEDDAAPDPGRPVLRRLNNAQYRNAIRDLFGVDFPAQERFPTDAVGHGFDTVGEALALPELRLEKALEAAEEIAAQVFVVDDSRQPRVERLEPGDLAGRGRVQRGFYVQPFGDEITGRVHAPRAGRYRMRIRAGAQQAGDEPARMGFQVAGQVVHEVEVPELPDRARVHETEVELPVAGTLAVGARFLNDYYDAQFPDPERRDRNLWVAWVELEGPLDPPVLSAFQQDLLARHGQESGRAGERAMLEHLARRVWRRPPTGAELERLELLPPAQAGPVARLRLQLTALLASPHFLYLVELDPPDAPDVRALSDHELAARLAAFLWSSVPDERMDALADAGQLGDPRVIEALVHSMLSDPRARALGEDFALQWLGLRALADAQPDPDLFPTWSEELRASMREETLRFFLTVLREGRSVWELLDADWTFVDGALATHYGVGAAGRDGFARVSLADTPRRGVLGQASVLTVTSDPTRTSPVKRGKWVLEVLLNAPPPAPPPGVDNLDESAEGIAARSLRQRLELHRERAECAVCHDRMDPLGFGLEPYDAVGRLRERDGRFAIDASGILPDGRSFDGPRGLVALLRADGRFPRAVLEKLLVYALGRGLERSDRRTVRALLAGLDPEAPSLSDMLVAVARSDAFRTRRVER